jgi:hypothetical protein
LSKKKPDQTPESCVLEIAQTLKKDNWEVQANAEGFSKPEKVGPMTPDVIAKKPGCLTQICQVATEDMFKGNQRDYQDFKNYCAEYDFHFYILKDGKRVQVDPESFRGKK